MGRQQNGCNNKINTVVSLENDFDVEFMRKVSSFTNAYTDKIWAKFWNLLEFIRSPNRITVNPAVNAGIMWRRFWGFIEIPEMISSYLCHSTNYLLVNLNFKNATNIQTKYNIAFLKYYVYIELHNGTTTSLLRGLLLPRDKWINICLLPLCQAHHLLPGFDGEDVTIVSL